MRGTQPDAALVEAIQGELEEFWDEYGCEPAHRMCLRMLDDLATVAPRLLTRGESAGWAAALIYEVVRRNYDDPLVEVLLITPETLMMIYDVSLEYLRSRAEQITRGLGVGVSSSAYTLSDLGRLGPPRLLRKPRRGSR